MIQMSLRFMPRIQQDLAWLAQTAGDLTEIYNLLLRGQLESDVRGQVKKPLTENELKAAVEGHAASTGTPLVQVSEGSMILQLSQYLDATVGVQVLLALGLLLKGPDVAAFSHKLREKWYSSAEDALRARNAYERLKKESVICVIEPTPSHDEVPGADAEPVPAPPRKKSPPASSA
jgi:hypothetical protein